MGVILAFFFLACLSITCLSAPPTGPYQLKSRFQGQPSDFHQDRGKAKIGSWFKSDTQDLTQGFPGAYKGDLGGQNIFIDDQGYLVIQPTCPSRLPNGDCKSIRCGDTMPNNQVCKCDNATIINQWFPWWCQLNWGSGKVISTPTFNMNAAGGLFVFEDLWIPRGKPLWPAVWLLPASNPVYGGKNTPKGGDWDVWPNNGEIDILETVGADPRIYGTVHYSSGNEYNGWPSFPVTANSSATRGTAYSGNSLNGNILATRSAGDNPLPTDGHIGTLCFSWFIDQDNGPTLIWYIADEYPVGSDGMLKVSDQLDVMLNRMGTNPTFGITGDGSGAISFGTTPFWPGSRGNSPPLTLYKGWNGKDAYGYQGYYPVQGNVRTASVGIHNGQVSSRNPTGLGIVPDFYSNGTAIPGTIAELFEPHLCSMIGDWGTPHPFPWSSTPCTNPPPGYPANGCPMTGTGPENSYNYCLVEGAKRPGVGWWSNSPMAKNSAFAPFDPTQNWNIMLNVAVGGQWPRAVGQEGDWNKDFTNIDATNLKMKSISYFEIARYSEVQ